MPLPETYHHGATKNGRPADKLSLPKPGARGRGRSCELRSCDWREVARPQRNCAKKARTRRSGRNRTRSFPGLARARKARGDDARLADLEGLREGGPVGAKKPHRTPPGSGAWRADVTRVLPQLHASCWPESIAKSACTLARSRRLRRGAAVHRSRRRAEFSNDRRRACRREPADERARADCSIRGDPPGLTPSAHEHSPANIVPACGCILPQPTKVGRYVARPWVSIYGGGQRCGGRDAIPFHYVASVFLEAGVSFRAAGPALLPTTSGGPAPRIAGERQQAGRCTLAIYGIDTTLRLIWVPATRQISAYRLLRQARKHCWLNARDRWADGDSSCRPKSARPPLRSRHRRRRGGCAQRRPSRTILDRGDFAPVLHHDHILAGRQNVFVEQREKEVTDVHSVGRIIGRSDRR